MDLHTFPLVCSCRRLLLNITLAALCVAGALAQNSPPVITVAPTNQWVPVTATAVLNVQASGTAPLRYQWQFNGTDLPGGDAATLTITNMQTAKAGDYAVHVSNDYGSTSASMRLTALQVVAWGATNYGQCVIPRSATNLVAIAAGQRHSLALQADGTVIRWGRELGFPAKGVTNATAIAASYNWAAALVNSPYSIPTWGSGAAQMNAWGVTPPNIVAISAGGAYGLALQGDGTVWRFGTFPPPVQSKLGEVTAIDTGDAHHLALRKDGTIAAWGSNDYGQTNVPAGLENVVAIAAGAYHSLALKADGEVVAWGRNQYTQTNVPAGLKDVVAIDAGFDNSMALTAAGQVHVWGSNSSGQTNVPFGLTNVIGMACGTDHCMVLMSESGLDLIREAGDQIAGQGEAAMFKPSVIGIPPLAYQWQRDGTNIPGATSSFLIFTNAQFANEGWYRLIVTNETGSLTTSNYQLNVLDLGEALNATNLVWTTKGQAPWRAAVMPNILDGAVAVCELTNVYAYTTGILQTVVSGPGKLTYSALNPGGIQFTVNGQMPIAFGSTNSVTTYLPAGNHVVRWLARSYGRNVYFIGDVSYVPGAIPPIVGNTSEVILPAGSKHQLGVSPLGTPPFHYEWSFNGSLLVGATNSMLLLAKVQPEHAGLYTVVVRNEAGSATSAMQVIVNPAAPQISSHPASRVMASGTSNSLQVIASGTEPLGYQWKRDGSPIPGATGPTLVFNPVQISDAATYAVDVSNALGTTSSSNATVAILMAAEQNASGGTSGVAFTSGGYGPWFPQTNVTHDGISALQSGDIPKGQLSILETSFTGPVTLSFWWKVSTATSNSKLIFEVDGVQHTVISGVVDWKQMTLLLGTGTHTVRWIMAPWIFSSGVDLGWLDEVTVTPGAVPASILSPLVNKTNAAGSTLSLAVTATGTPPLAYQWKFNGTDLPGATNATLTVTNMQAANAGVYAISVSNGHGPEVSSSATVTVTPSKPTLTQGLASMARPLNGSAVFQVTAVGTPPFLYTWFFEGASVESTDIPEFSVTGLKPSHAGKYQVKVENDYGAVTSAVATLTVHPTVVLDLWPRTVARPPRFDDAGDVVAVAAGRQHTSVLRSDGTVISWGDNGFGQTDVPPGLSNVVAIAAGENHTLALRADGSLIGWGDDLYGQILPQGVQPGIAIAASWNDSMVLQADGTLLLMSYFANAVPVPPGLSNVVGIARSTVGGVAVLEDGSLTGWGRPHLVPGPTSNMVQTAATQAGGYGLRADGTVQVWGLSAATNAAIQPNGGILALYAESSSSAGGYALMVYTNGTLSASPVSAEYWLQIPPGLTNVVSADAGYDHAVLLLRDGSPFLTRRLLNRTAPAGSRVAFYPGISGSQPMAYQWYHDGNVIQGATNLTLILDQVSATAAGLYHCRATNPLGTITIPPAKLTVTAPVPNPGLQLALSSQGTAGQVRLQVSGLSGTRQVVIHTSTDLLNWQSVSTNTPVSGTVEFIDQTTTATQRFYKATEQ